MAERVSPTWLKAALKGKSWRSSATRVPPTAVPATRPMHGHAAAPDHAARGHRDRDAGRLARGDERAVEAARARRRSCVATARKW